MMVTNLNDQNTILEDDMKKAMPIIYGELRELFFRHIHKKLPRFEGFDAPEIRVLDETEPDTLGKYSVDQAMEMIEPIMEQICAQGKLEDERLQSAVNCLNQIIRDYNCGEIKKKSDFKGLLRELLGILDEVKTEAGKAFNNDVYKKIIEAINILENVVKEVVTLGEFISEKNLIILYSKVHDQSNGNSTLENHMLVTLAHELFHAMHCSVRGKDKWKENSGPKRKTVVESLARWAQYCWCKHQYGEDFKNIADDLKQEWKTSDFPSDPYAGAKVFDNGGVVDIEVLDVSIKDWDKAYRMMDPHRNDEFFKESIDSEAKKLFGKLTRKISIRDLLTKDWAIIHPHDLKMNEWYNLTTCKLVQYELEQSGFEVIRIPCKGPYLNRNKGFVWGKSALLFIIKNEEVPADSFRDSMESVAKKHANTVIPFFGAVSLRSHAHDVMCFKTQGSDKESVKIMYEPYKGFEKYSIETDFQDIFCRIGAIESKLKP